MIFCPTSPVLWKRHFSHHPKLLPFPFSCYNIFVNMLVNLHWYINVYNCGKNRKSMFVIWLEPGVSVNRPGTESVDSFRETGVKRLYILSYYLFLGDFPSTLKLSSSSNLWRSCLIIDWIRVISEDLRGFKRNNDLGPERRWRSD